jgi:signal transduction histidine kinase
MQSVALAPRVVAFLVAAQFAAFLAGWAVTTGLGIAGVDIFLESWDGLATARAEKQVISSLKTDEQGVVRIEPTEDLRAELRRAAAMKFAVFDKNKQALPGSDPELVKILTPIIGISPTHTHFALPGDVSAAPVGLMQAKRTPFGRLQVAVHGQKFRWGDVFDAWQTEFRWLIGYVAMGILISTGTGWIAVRNGLRPLRTIAKEACAIDMETLDRRLTLNAAPREVMPLVRAMNEALERLDIGIKRQRLFTANAAHELRTPVALLSARLDAPKQPDHDNQLKRDVRRITHIIDQLLANARAGENIIRFDEPIDLSESVRAVVDDAALLAIRHKREIEYIGGNTASLVRGDKSAIEAVLANLVDNALHAEPEGGRVVVRAVESGIVEIADHGPGVADADREVIFEPFWRKRKDASGSGLGLAISKALMLKLGGRIWVEDTPGGGATFKISFPTIVS